MIERTGKYFCPVCDVCGTVLNEDGYDDFYDAVTAKKAAGWKSRQFNGEWSDLCPDCAAKIDKPSSDEFAGFRG